MKLTVCAILSITSIVLAFADPDGYGYRASGPFDSESCLVNPVTVKWNTNSVSLRPIAMSGTQCFSQPRLPPSRRKEHRLRDDQQSVARSLQLCARLHVDAVNMVFQFGISTTNRPNETFNLVDLARHDTIEADGSLTRNDIYFGDDVHFDASVFAPVARDLGLDHSHRADRYVTVDTAAKAAKNRLDLAKRANPAFNASAIQHATEYGTTALYLLTVWDEQKQASPKSWVHALLGKTS
jgi:hypothetical protein